MTRSRGVSTVPYIMVALDRRPMWCATCMTPSHSSLVHLARAILRRDAVDEDLGAAPGNAVEPCGPQPLEHRENAQALEARDVQDLLG